MLENAWSTLRPLYTSEGRRGLRGIVLPEELIRSEEVLDSLFLEGGLVLGAVRQIRGPKLPRA